VGFPTHKLHKHIDYFSSIPPGASGCFHIPGIRITVHVRGVTNPEGFTYLVAKKRTNISQKNHPLYTQNHTQMESTQKGIFTFGEHAFQRGHKHGGTVKFVILRVFSQCSIK
jgi:hypothetical protein